MSGDIILRTESLTREVPGKVIIDNISLSFEKNKIYSLIGPSGAGKSSFLRLLNRLDEPTSGEVFFHDSSACEDAPNRIRRKIGYLFQTPYLFPETVKDNFLYANESITDDEIDNILAQVHIEKEILGRKVNNLSVGQSQRVALGRLLATRPEIILLDEPTSSLDPTYTEAIEQTILEIVKNTDLTVIVVTHHPNQALRFNGETILLVDGKLVEIGPAEKIINDPESELGKRYKNKQLK
ncbi:MAG: ATP-binding cassette domain-containing protein [bacterium]